MPSAVVFGYHNVGARCLRVLLAHGLEVPLVVTHEDSPSESIWFDSVADIARLHGLETATPADPNDGAIAARLAALRPDYLFSFYYRHMLGPELLASASRGAFNMHGSILPKYRGRVPVNWAIIRGERATGATLHEMVAKPDAGRIVDQQSVPILPNDTAHDVFVKVTVAAELVLDRALPGLVAGTTVMRDQDLGSGSYFGGRKPEDGRIDWTRDAWEIHNLIRAVAPPYPGAFTTIAGRHARILSTHWRGVNVPIKERPALYVNADRLFIRCFDGGVLELLALELDGEPVENAELRKRFSAEIPL